MHNTIHSPISILQSLIPGRQTRAIDFLRAENQILRKRLPGRLLFTDAERRTLVKFGLRIRDCLEQVATLVKPETILAWNRQFKKHKWDYSKRRGGRRRKRDDVEEIAVRLAMDNTWGYVRIQGELAKLGHSVSPSWIRSVLIKHGIPPSPRRNGISWKEFINAHLDCAWATDFFTEEVWTHVGLVTCYVLFFIQLSSRRVHIAGCTHNPNSAWVSQQARNFIVMQEETTGNACRYVIHDRDTTFHAMDNVFQLSGVCIVKTAYQTPVMNAFAERFVREARETLDRMIIVGDRHLLNVLKKVEHYHNNQRPHQGIQNKIPCGYDPPEIPASPHEVQCEELLGGLLKHYFTDRKAA